MSPKQRIRPARGAADVFRRTIGPGLLWVCAIAAALTLACGDSEPLPAPTENGGTEPPPPVEAEDPPPDEEPDPGGAYTLEVPVEDVGEHLEATEFWAPVPSWLEASADPVVASLPARARASTGKLFQPSDDSPTKEVFWLHVISDRTRQDAIDWVKHLASQDPSLARILTPRNHDVFGAAFRPAPVVGDVSVWIELLHGHDNGCWRSDLLVFAQDGLVILLANGIEITREIDSAAQQAARGAALCSEPEAVAPLTDLNSIARVISDRLYSLYSDD